MKMRIQTLIFVGNILGILFCLAACTTEENKIQSKDIVIETEENIVDSWNVEDYIDLEDIVSIAETEDDNEEVNTYKICYLSDESKVNSYLSIPSACTEQQETYPCMIYNRGGNREYGVNKPSDIAKMAELLDCIIFASQYRGNAGGTGIEEFGGADLQDVIKLIDLSEKFSFVNHDRIYMMGGSRGGMMTYMALREDERIKKGIVISGIADVFMTYDERIDMREVVLERLIGGSPVEMQEEYEKRSATYWADEIKCPVLIIHSMQDTKVSYQQATKMAECLADAGREYKLITYEDDKHGFHKEDFDIIKEWCNLGEEDYNE